MWNTWQVSLRSRVRKRVRHQVPGPLAVGSAMCYGGCFYLGPDRFDLQFATKELAQDMQTPSMLSMLRLRRFVRYLLGAADVEPFFRVPG